MAEVHVVPRLRTRSLPPRSWCRDSAVRIECRIPGNFRYVLAFLPRWRGECRARAGRSRHTAPHFLAARVEERSAMELGKLGVWVGMDGMSAAQAAAFAKRVEEWGYGALWIPESRGRNALVHSSWLLAHTERLAVATGIANIYARDPMAMANGQRTLAEQSGGRFLLGVGVSHRPMVEGLRGHSYGKPVSTMRAYLQAMREAPYQAPEPPEQPLTVVAALGPRMMALSGERADGAHPYNTTPEHTAQARSILGPGKLLCPEVWVVLETDPAG